MGNKHQDRLKEKNLSSRAVLLLLCIFFLVFLGGKARIFGVFLIIFFAALKCLPWKYLFAIGLFLMPVKMIGVANVGFHVQLHQVFLVGAVLGAVVDRHAGLRWNSGIFDARIILGLLTLVLSSFQSIYISADPVVILGAFRNYPWIKSLSRILFIGVMIGFAFFVRAYASNNKAFRQILNVLFFSSGIFSLIGIIGFGLYFAGIENVFGAELVTQSGDELPRIKVFEWEPLYFGSYLLTVTPVIILLLFCRNTSFSSKRSLQILCAVNMIAILLTFSRGVWLGLIAALMYILILQRDKIREITYQITNSIRNSIKRFPIIFGFFAIIIVLIIVSSGQNIITLLDKAFVQPLIGAIDPSSGKFWSTRLRLMTVGIGLNEWLDHPFLGIGFENFSFYAGNIFIYGLLSHAINYPDVGSLPFKILIETGLIGFVLLSGILAKSFADLRVLINRTKADDLKHIIQGYVAGAIGLLVQSLFFSNILSVYLWVMLGMILAAINLSEQSTLVQD